MILGCISIRPIFFGGGGDPNSVEILSKISKFVEILFCQKWGTFWLKIVYFDIKHPKTLSKPENTRIEILNSFVPTDTLTKNLEMFCYSLLVEQKYAFSWIVPWGYELRFNAFATWTWLSSYINLGKITLPSSPGEIYLKFWAAGSRF